MGNFQKKGLTLIITKYVTVKVDVFVDKNWKKISQEEELDLLDKDEVAEHILNECDYRFEFEGEKIGHISDTEIVSVQDHAPIGC